MKGSRKMSEETKRDTENGSSDQTKKEIRTVQIVDSDLYSSCHLCGSKRNHSLFRVGSENNIIVAVCDRCRGDLNRQHKNVHYDERGRPSKRKAVWTFLYKFYAAIPSEEPDDWKTFPELWAAAVAANEDFSAPTLRRALAEFVAKEMMDAIHEGRDRRYTLCQELWKEIDGCAKSKEP